MNLQKVKKAQRKLAFLERAATDKVLRFLVESPTPVTPTDTSIQIRSMPKSDVFRTMSELWKMGLAHKIRLGDNAFYSPNYSGLKHLARCVRKFEYDVYA